MIAGAGTSCQELIEEVGDLDVIFVCIGGGGLVSGTCVTARELLPKCKLYGVEPEAGNDA